MTPVELLLSKLSDAKSNGQGWRARCPAHDDRRPSLSIAEGDDGRALVKCHAGCTPHSIVRAVGLNLTDLMPANGYEKAKPRIIAQYDYRDEVGNVVFQAVRYEPKDFRQRRPRPGGGWEWKVKGTRVIPYNLPELLADPGRPVVVPEGEKDCDNLHDIGVLATCNAGGAGKWTAEHAAFLKGRHVIVLPDNDDAGRKHAQQVARSLHGIAESVRIVELPDLLTKGDVSDWLAAGGSKAELDRLAEATPIWTPDAQPWADLDSFDVLKLPDFPTHVLPAPLRQWVEAESHATQTPADLAALLALSVCSSCLARRVVVEPRPGWLEPVNVFTAVLLEPGNRKSAVFADAIKPLRELESELVESVRPAKARAQSERRQKESRMKKCEKRSAEQDDSEARDEAFVLAEELAGEPEPDLPRLIVDDATAEKLGIMLAEQGGRIASMSPEGGVFDLMAGLYSKSGIPQFGVYLMGHSGDDLVTDRVGREGVRVERPALTCAYAMQPAVIKGLADDNPAFRGRGLLARFLYAAPRSWIGRRQIAPEPVSDVTRDSYRQLVRRLADVKEEYVLCPTPAARASFERWEAEIENLLADGGQMELTRDWGAKLAGATLRLAAVLHGVEGGLVRPIEERTIAAAVEIARYLIPHAEAMLNMMEATEGSADSDAQYVLRWIKRHGLRQFTKRDAQQHGKRKFPKADDIDSALAELERRAYIRPKPVEVTGPGRRPSPTYEVNPAVLARTAPNKRSRNSHNSPKESQDGDSENFESASGGLSCVATVPSVEAACGRALRT